jgi:hypothetical protein
MPELIADEIETLRMLAGQLPRRLGSKHILCIEELASIGLCGSVEPYRLTATGIHSLEVSTGTIDLRSRRVA